jgi:hypothetical protein
MGKNGIEFGYFPAGHWLAPHSPLKDNAFRQTEGLGKRRPFISGFGFQ